MREIDSAITSTRLACSAVPRTTSAIACMLSRLSPTWSAIVADNSCAPWVLRLTSVIASVLCRIAPPTWPAVCAT